MESIQAQSTQEPTEFTDGTDDGGRITAAGALDALVDGVGIPRGTVILAATPIGNTADASARLIALMEGADIVAAEDTRRLYALANRLGISGIKAEGIKASNNDCELSLTLPKKHLEVSGSRRLAIE